MEVTAPPGQAGFLSWRSDAQYNMTSPCSCVFGKKKDRGLIKMLV